jgi:hypothetical protein
VSGLEPEGRAAGGARPGVTSRTWHTLVESPRPRAATGQPAPLSDMTSRASRAPGRGGVQRKRRDGPLEGLLDGFCRQRASLVAVPESLRVCRAESRVGGLVAQGPRTLPIGGSAVFARHSGVARRRRRLLGSRRLLVVASRGPVLAPQSEGFFDRLICLFDVGVPFDDVED